MTLDLISNTSSFAQLPDWSLITEFLAAPDLLTCEAKRYDIDGDRLYAIVADDVFKEGASPLEAHRKYIDVQVALIGSFNVLWKPLAQCVQVKKEYDADDDYLLMSDEAHTRIHLSPGVALVLHPADAHAPQPPTDRVRKVVFKIRNIDIDRG